MSYPRTRPVTITANSDHSVSNFAGFSIRESAGTAAPAAVNIRHADGAGTNTGTIIHVIELAGDESKTVDLFAPIRATAADGVHVEVVTGSVEGVLHERD